MDTPEEALQDNSLIRGYVVENESSYNVKVDLA